jgi:hypothetical protein
VKTGLPSAGCWSAYGDKSDGGCSTKAV